MNSSKTLAATKILDQVRATLSIVFFIAVVGCHVGQDLPDWHQAGA